MRTVSFREGISWCFSAYYWLHQTCPFGSLTLRENAVLGGSEIDYLRHLLASQQVRPGAEIVMSIQMAAIARDKSKPEDLDGFSSIYTNQPILNDSQWLLYIVSNPRTFLTYPVVWENSIFFCRIHHPTGLKLNFFSTKKSVISLNFLLPFTFLLLMGLQKSQTTTWDV